MTDPEKMNFQESLKNKIDLKTKPLGSLGMLEDIAYKIGSIQQSLTPEITKPTVLVFAADHGLADSGVSPYPKEVTYQMVMNFLQGGAAINVFTKIHGLDLKVIDAGVDYDFAENESLLHKKIAHGTKNILEEPAMSKDHAEKAIAVGRELIKKEAESGCNTIAFGEMGIGNTSSASLIMSKVLQLPVADCVGRGAGLDDEGLGKKINILEQISAKYNINNDVIDILSTFGGFEIAMMTGAFLEALKQNMIIIVDGFIVTAALLLAHKINPCLTDNCLFAHQSDENAHGKMLNYLNARAILNLNMRLGEGSGAAVAFPIIKSAVAFLNEMASFADAGVANI